ncbi:MAG: MBOAT family O-acyltransferase [Anaerovoracaceae bacterium]|jgi:alginate O-acetyltransferase complex protein AlgI
MSFVSFTFLGFLAVVLVLYYLLPKKVQWIFLLIASYGFYLFGGLKPLFFILFTTFFVYACGRWMEHIKNIKKTKSEAKKVNRRIIVMALLVNFGILLLLKYYNFAAENLNGLFSGNSDPLPLVNIVLPLGISFYTFQAMGYLIDIYRNKYEAETNPARFALFISFFPQVVQGPISRYDDLGTQLMQEHHFDYKTVKFGAQLMLWGYFKKMVIADRAGVLVSQVFGNWSDYDGTQTLVAIIIYAIQIYADFSGGIDMARGAAGMMGIDLVENFRRPYFGSSVADYWRRWHMSLTNWMRDYVFFPLTLSKMSSKIGKWGRKNLGGIIGKQVATYIPTFVTFFLIGIWHGAGWGFITYGLYNASIIVIAMILTPAFDSAKSGLHINEKSIGWRIWQAVRTFFIMAAGKCITRAVDVHAAFAMIKKSFGFFHFDNFIFRMTSMGLTGKNLIVLAAACAIFFVISLLQENGIGIRESIRKLPLGVRWAIYLGCLAAIFIFGYYGPGYSASEFVYRNF